MCRLSWPASNFLLEELCIVNDGKYPYGCMSSDERKKTRKMNSVSWAKNRFSSHFLRLVKNMATMIRTAAANSTDAGFSRSTNFFTSQASEGPAAGENKSLSKQELLKERESLLEEAAALTRSLYRICFRSVRHIRNGNEYDEKEFQEREQKRLEPKERDSRVSMLSMLPPVDRDDELRSRAEYYRQYTRENFVQESDCLSYEDWNAQHVARYLFHLRRGDEHRKWLLNDMKFEDPFKHAFDHDRVGKFEERATNYIKRKEFVKLADLSPEVQELHESQSQATMRQDDDDDIFTDDEDDDAPGLPEWYRNPRSQ